MIFDILFSPPSSVQPLHRAFIFAVCSHFLTRLVTGSGCFDSLCEFSPLPDIISHSFFSQHFCIAHEGSFGVESGELAASDILDITAAYSWCFSFAVFGTYCYEGAPMVKHCFFETFCPQPIFHLDASILDL